MPPTPVAATASSGPALVTPDHPRLTVGRFPRQPKRLRRSEHSHIFAPNPSALNPNAGNACRVARCRCHGDLSSRRHRQCIRTIGKCQDGPLAVDVDKPWHRGEMQVDLRRPHDCDLGAKLPARRAAPADGQIEIAVGAPGGDLTAPKPHPHGHAGGEIDTQPRPPAADPQAIATESPARLAPSKTPRLRHRPPHPELISGRMPQLDAAGPDLDLESATPDFLRS